MAWSKDYGDGEDKSAVYDLRQVYATELVGMTLKQIDTARKLGSYSTWFKLLKRDLYSDLHQKLKEKERIAYQEKLKQTIGEINKYPLVYLGKSKDGLGNDVVENAIQELEMFMKDLMEKHKLFGAKEEAELI